MSLFAMLVYTAILLYYGTFSFTNGANNYFVSIDATQGICSVIVKTVDISLLASIHDGSRGIWQPSPEYQTNSTAYLLELKGFKCNFDIYINIIRNQS